MKISSWENYGEASVRMAVKRGFFLCDVECFKTREAGPENVLLVLKFFTHMRDYEVGEHVHVYDNAKPDKHWPMRVVSQECEEYDTGFRYTVVTQSKIKLKA